MLLYLDSVGSFVNTDTLMAYPALIQEGTPDMNCGVHFEDIEGEWFNCLSSDDFDTLYRFLDCRHGDREDPGEYMSLYSYE